MLEMVRTFVWRNCEPREGNPAQGYPLTQVRYQGAVCRLQVNPVKAQRVLLRYA